MIQAAAHGLPIVATKNGGPVDIHRVSLNPYLRSVKLAYMVNLEGVSYS